jgi:hypothetical protein
MHKNTFKFTTPSSKLHYLIFFNIYMKVVLLEFYFPDEKKDSEIIIDNFAKITIVLRN